MKELSIEEKAQRYDEALKVAKDIRNGEATYIQNGTPVIEAIFPELAESDDERIRKSIIAIINNYVDNSNTFKPKMLAWLEKQGEHANFRNKIQVGDKVTRNRDGMLVNLSQLKRVAKPADKVEPNFNFKAGQWIVATGKCVYLIIKIDGFNVTLVDVDGNEYVFDTSSLEDAHLWTIQDAKDGDVLAFKNNIGGIIICKSPTNYDTRSYCRLISDNLINKEESGWDSTLIVPATKEQRKQLERAMADAGYTFDFDKKELKKIEQKPAWSEEDEAKLKSILFHIEDVENKDVIDWLKSLRDRVQPQQEWSEEDYNQIETIACHLDNIGNEGMAEVLRNIRDKYYHKTSWKPSEEQMDMLAKVCSTLHLTSGENEIMESIYDALKKLREE